jgi:hypothetical protein
MNADSLLEREAEYLHRSLFSPRTMPPEVKTRYAAFNRKCLPNGGVSPLAQAVVENALDAEAVEYALRVFRGPTVLTRKMQALLFLLEVRSEYYAEFVNERTSRAAARAALGGHGIRAVAVLLRGWLTARRYGLFRHADS